MSDSIHRRHHDRQSAEPAPAGSHRIVLRRRRCSEPPTRRRQRRGGGAWRQMSMVAFVLLAAGPVWAIGEAVAERYHEQIASLFRRTQAPVAFEYVASPTADAAKAFPQSAPAASHDAPGAFARAFASVWESSPGVRTQAALAAAPANPYARSFPAPASAPASAPLTGSAFASSFAAHAVSRPAVVSAARAQAAASASSATVTTAATTVRPAITVGSDTWSGGSSTTSADPNWETGGNWVGGEAPAPGGSADIVYTPTPAGATATNVDVNYTINSLTFQGPIAGVGGLPATDTPAYTVTGSSGVSLTVGAGGITDASANTQKLTVPVVLGAAQTWSVSNASGDLTVQTAITGTGGITKTGPGTLNLGGSQAVNNFGTLTVSQGTVQLDKDFLVLAISGDLIIGNAASPGAAGSAVAQLNNPFQTGTGTNVTIYSDGLFDLDNASGNGSTDNYTPINNLTMTGGEVRVGLGQYFGGGGLLINGGITTNASATSALISSTDFADDVYLNNGATTVSVARGTATYDLDVQAGIADGVLTKTGAGVLRLAGTINTGLAVTLNAGTLALASDAALGDTGDGSNTPSTFTLAGGTVVADGGDRTIANPIAFTGDATIGDSLDGTPRAITFTGTTTLTGSQTLTVNNTAATTFSGAVNLNGANTLTIGGTGNTLISGVVGDGGAGGGLTKQGAGTLTLTANNTYDGTTAVSDGKLFVNNVPAKAGDSGTGSGAVYVEPSGAGTWLGGTGTIGGNTVVGDFPAFTPTLRVGVQPALSVGMATLTPGVAGPGVLTFNGNLTLTSGTTTTELDIAGAAPGTGYDQVKVGGNLTLAGNLTLNVGAGVKLSVGETFYIFDLTSTAGTLSGMFENASLDGTFTDSAGDVYTINYAATDPADGDNVANDVSLTVLDVPEPGTWAWMGVGAAVMAAGVARHRIKS